MKANHPPVRVTFRIPGAWAHPGELLERLPEGCRLSPEALVLPDGAEFEFIPMPPDDQFAEIFDTSCRRPATEDELAIVSRYTVNVGLCGPGGSIDDARAMMRAGSVIVRAGGAGVFIDNSALSHGGGDWLEMTDDGTPDAVSFAFVSVIAGQGETRTMGMHVIGFPDIFMPATGPDDDSIIDVVRYVCNEDQPIGDGHLLGDEHGPRFRAAMVPCDRFPVESPMHNPFGCLKLTDLKEIAEGN